MSSLTVHDHFVVPFPKEQVYEALVRFQDFPRWWPTRFRVTLQQTGRQGRQSRYGQHGEYGPGNRVTFHPVPGLTVGWEITALQPDTYIAIDYYRGPHTGHGSWLLTSQANGTLVSYEIQIRPKNFVLAMIYRVLRVDKMHSRHLQLVLGCLERYLAQQA